MSEINSNNDYTKFLVEKINSIAEQSKNILDNLEEIKAKEHLMFIRVGSDSLFKGKMSWNNWYNCVYINYDVKSACILNKSSLSTIKLDRPYQRLLADKNTLELIHAIHADDRRVGQTLLNGMAFSIYGETNYEIL